MLAEQSSAQTNLSGEIARSVEGDFTADNKNLSLTLGTYFIWISAISFIMQLSVIWLSLCINSWHFVLLGLYVDYCSNLIVQIINSTSTEG